VKKRDLSTIVRKQREKKRSRRYGGQLGQVGSCEGEGGRRVMGKGLKN